MENKDSFSEDYDVELENVESEKVENFIEESKSVSLEKEKKFVIDKIDSNYKIVLETFYEYPDRAIKSSVLDILVFSYYEVIKNIRDYLENGGDYSIIENQIKNYFKQLETVKKLSEQNFDIRVSGKFSNSEQFSGLLNLLRR